jgi:hypothetical protein
MFLNIRMFVTVFKKNSPLDSIVSEMNLVHNSTPHVCNINLV